MVNKFTFVGFMGAIAPLDPPQVEMLKEYMVRERLGTPALNVHPSLTLNLSPKS